MFAVLLEMISPAISESSVTMNAPVHDRMAPIRFGRIHRFDWEKINVVANTAFKIATNEPRTSLILPKIYSDEISLK
jgi:hypothetical protein